MPSKTKKPTSFHWGSYYAEIENENLVVKSKDYYLDLLADYILDRKK